MTKTNSINIALTLLAVIGTSVTVGCKKLIEVPSPVNSLTSDNVYSSDISASTVLTGVYSQMSPNSLAISATGIGNISFYQGLCADELSLYGGSTNTIQQLVECYTNRLTPGTSTTPSAVGCWYDCYKFIYIVNLALERISKSANLTPGVRKQLIGEAKFIRAFSYFYLVNLYGDVPLTTTSDYRTNSILPRSSKALVYDQIILDLIDAQSQLSDNYLAADVRTVTTERVRPTKWAATALLARTYLYMGDFANAELQSSAVINRATKFGLETLANAFVKNNNEAIWQLQPVSNSWNTDLARIFILPFTGPTSNSADGNPVFLDPKLVSAFEQGDLRKGIWVDSVMVNGTRYHYANKYKSATLNAPVTEYLTVLRLAEQYLIRAESRIQLGDIAQGIADLNALRDRATNKSLQAGDPGRLGVLGSSISKNDALKALNYERRIEMFTEWGDRWFDAKRTKKIDEIMSSAAVDKGTTWYTDWALFPIPLYEIVHDPNLKQNPGY